MFITREVWEILNYNPQRIIIRIKWEKKALFSSSLLLLSYIEGLLLCDTVLAALYSLWLNEINYCFHFTEKETEFQRREVTCSKLHTWGTTKLGWFQSLNSPLPAIMEVQFKLFFPFRRNLAFKSVIEFQVHLPIHILTLLVYSPNIYWVPTVGKTPCLAVRMQLWTRPAWLIGA